jgi:hypothetical protein
MPRPQPDPDPDSFWPSCDEQPGVTIRPLSHADLTALVAHLDQHDRHQDLDDTPGRGEPAPVLAVRVRQRRPARRLRRRRVPASADRRVGRLDPRPALASGRGTDRWRSRLAADRPGHRPPVLRGRSGGGIRGGLGGAIPRLSQHPCLAAWGGWGAPHRAPARPAGAAGVGGAARPGHPWLSGQYRSSGDRPRRCGRD